jgi:hypothetical protein
MRIDPTTHVPRLHLGAAPGQHLHVGTAQCGLRHGAHGSGVGRQQRAVTDHREAVPRAERPARGQHQLHTGRAAADDDQRQRLLPGQGQRSLPQVDEALHRPHEKRMLAGAGQAVAVLHRAGVHRQQVVADALAVGQRHHARGRIQCHRAAQAQRHAGGLRQRGDVDGAVVRGVAAGEQAGHHARVPGAHRRCHQRHLGARQSPLRERGQHRQLGMARPQQQHALHRGSISSAAT